jgi:tartrate dehydrogenase/decarboxylase/D-malate dehydrogenase
MNSPKRIAVIAGDGIGQEVMPEGLRVMEAVADLFGIKLQFDHFDFSSWNYFERHGKMLPDNWKEQIGGHDAIYFGAVGWPEKIPDHLSLWGSLLQFRREFDQYVNLRPARLMPGVRAPVVRRDGSARLPGEIDMVIVRENTEGEYSSIGGRMFAGTEREVVIQETVMTRTGVDRVLEFAFLLAQSRPKKHLTSATKSNGISITMPFWDERVEAMAKRFPEVRVDKFHIDILTAHFVQRPEFFDVVVGSNLFGDILSDLGPACTGTIAIAPSANLNPERRFPSLFEPVHGSAPDIAGRGIANPIGQIWSGAMMLDFLGFKLAHDAVLAAIERTLEPGSGAPRTPDMGGAASTQDLGRAIARGISAEPLVP